MAGAMNIKLEPVDMGLELGKIQVEVNQSKPLVQQSCSQSNVESLQQFNMQTIKKQIQQDNKSSFSFRMEPEVNMEPEIPKLLTGQQIQRASASKLIVYASACSAKIQQQKDQMQQQQQQIQQKDLQIQQKDIQIKQKYIQIAQKDVQIEQKDVQIRWLQKQVEFAQDKANINHHQRNVQEHIYQPHRQQ